MYLDTIAMAKRLEGPYKEVFEKADMYSMDGKDATNDKMMDLFDMLMEAQEEDKPVEKIVGDDLETFCKNFFQEQRILDDINIFQWLYRIAWIGMLFVIWDFWDFYQIESSDASIWDMRTEISSIFGGIIAGVVGSFLLAGCIKYILQPLVFKNKKMKQPVYSVLIIVLFVVTFGLPLYFMCQFNIQIRISSAWMLIGLAGYIITYLIVRSVLRYWKHGTILNHDKKRKKEEQKELDAFNKEISAEVERKETAEIMAKQFKKLQEKYERRGKGIYTQEMFAEKTRKEEKFFANPVAVWCLDAFFIFAIGVCPTIDIIKNDGVVQAFIFASILLTVQILLCRFFNRIINEVSVEKLDILNRCEEQGIDIVAYAENVLEQTNEHGVSYE